MDVQVIQARLKKLDESYKSLERFRHLSLEEYLKSEDIQAIVERKLQVSIQTCMDIANYLIAHRQLKIPDDEKGIFDVLTDAGIITAALARRLKGMVNFRNILVHEYLDVDAQIVHEHLTQKLDDFSEFAQAIVRYYG